jgi:membrane protease YdiL (CAAX protease family)
MFAVLQFGTPWLMRWLDQPASAIVATATMVILALAFERAFYGRGPLRGLAALGWGTPPAGAIAAAAILALAMLAFFPLAAAATGAAIALRPDWWWVLLGAIAFNGIGEETLFRGYVFGGLRRAGLGFTAAASVSLVVFAAVHLFLFVQNPFVIGLLGTLVAVAAAFPLAFLYERGNNTIWAPALFHTATHAIRFVEVSEPHRLTVTTAWLVLQLALPFAVFLFAGSLLRNR